MEPQPPHRSTHVIGGPARMLVYDRWGRYGRPVVLLHGLLFDRTMWWPVAAELASTTACTVVAPDLPGHGDSPPRTDYDLERLAYDLVQLVQRLDLQRAPIVVGHAESEALATAFSHTFAVHEVLTVNDLGEGRAQIADQYQHYARLRNDATLLAAYAKWPRQARTWPHLANPRGFAAELQTRLGARRA